MTRNTLLALLFTVCICAGFVRNGHCGADEAVLEISSSDGKLLRTMKISPLNGFAIRYIHSVALSPVTDFFTVRGNSIVLDKTVYMDFGAGLPHAPEEGQTMRVENGRIIISGFERQLPELVVRVGRVARHTLLVPAKNGYDESTTLEIPLTELAPPGSAITFSIRPE